MSRHLQAACRLTTSQRAESCTSSNNVYTLSALLTRSPFTLHTSIVQHSPSSELLDELVAVVEGRVLHQQQELLTLESLIKLAWGLACFKQYR